jgi:alpha-galactosidase
MLPLRAMPAPRLAQLEGAGHLEPLRVAVRLALDPASEGSGGPEPRRAGGPIAAPFAAGHLRLGPLGVQVALDCAGDAALVETSVRNEGERPLRLDALLVGLRWVGPPAGALRFLRQGWQSWSETGARELSGAGDPSFPSGPWLRGFHHALGEPPADRAGWHESHLVSVVGVSPSGPACLAGVLEAGRSFGLVYLRPVPGAVEIELELRLEVPLAPGEGRDPEPLRMALGRDASVLLEAFAEELGRRAGARCAAPFRAGWCSWYHYFQAVDETALRRNLEEIALRRDELPVDVIQLDDGYQRAVGDWLETNARFPRGLAPLAAEIRDAGFTPGLWTAPFCVVPESRLFARHRAWCLRRGPDLHRGLLHAEWSAGGFVYVLDPTREEVRAHLRRTFAALVGLGFDYLKLDFLYTAAMEADAYDPAPSRAERLRAGLEAIRAGAGPEAFLLGCGCPLGPAVGVVDGMRIGPDVAPSWGIEGAAAIAGIEATQPASRNALPNILARLWMHRRLWLNDPDCLMARSSRTRLREDERRTLATAIAASGGMPVFSDDASELDPDARRLVRETIVLARAVDVAAPRGVARALDLLGPEPAGLVARSGAGTLLALVNAGDAPRGVEVELARLGVGADAAPPQPLLGTAPAREAGGGRLRVELAPHASACLRLARPGRLAVFCDFDGTFAVQDVGATLARRHRGDRRPALWARLERGELTPWGYNLELLDGLPLPEAELEAFLRSVELSPGARELVAWCEAWGVPFRVLSDGFDYNLDRLQVLHGVRFEYEANRLRYEGGAWRIEAAHPNPACECGTGTCKRGRIEAFRLEQPKARVVHIGNGRVSDLCAALAADVVLAKDSLAEALRERGVPFEPFETLRDALPVLERLLAAA